MFYKNCGYTEKTFYGITFKPGEIQEVPGYINAKHFIRMSENDVLAALDVQESQPKRNKVGRPPKSQQQEKAQNSVDEKESLIKEELVQETVEDEPKDRSKSQEKDKEKD